MIYQILDANNLSERLMMLIFLSGIPDWVNSQDFNLDNYCNDSRVGCFLEVDLDYPDELQDFHNDFPLVG